MIFQSGKQGGGVRRMSHEVAAQKRSLSGASHVTFSSTTAKELLNLSNVPANIKQLLETQFDWGFDIIELERITQRRPLVWLGSSVLNAFNICQILTTDEVTVRNWLALIEANYHDNPYHNSTHAADVMQSTAYFLRKPRLKFLMDPLDEAICLIAAIVHDVDHPGKNSAFLCNSNSPLAILYNDMYVCV